VVEVVGAAVVVDVLLVVDVGAIVGVVVVVGVPEPPPPVPQVESAAPPTTKTPMTLRSGFATRDHIMNLQ
jgi:hypothetical protein